MGQERERIYKVNLPLQDIESVFAFRKTAAEGLNWLKDRGREDVLINVYMGKDRATFVLTDLETALLMRLSLQ